MGDTYNLQIGKKIIQYQLRVSTRARRLRITVSADGVVVTIPRGITHADAQKFLLEHSGWITAQLDKMSRHGSRNQLPEDVLLWQGSPVQLQRIEEPGRKSRAKVEQANSRLRVYLPVGSKISTREAAQSWMRAESRQMIEKMVVEQARRMGARPKAISIRDQRTRWGSCSSRGGLSFNWRLVMTPPWVMEYVVVHELAHLFQPNHSKDFWMEVGRYFPDYKAARTWLRKNGPVLKS